MPLETPRDLPHIRRLEDLHLRFVTGRLRKRKRITISAEDFEPFENAIKAALPPIDLTSHGFTEEQERAS